ncbi:hypothetical protein [Nonomuraea typhae]|uniref:hypothetical protein n=1 Tax=Nonomuraea typhae TaxID=2603600 RepID=UPI0015E23898|nr:hypothetical protein [Nonomuraea typhae]
MNAVAKAHNSVNNAELKIFDQVAGMLTSLEGATLGGDVRLGARLTEVVDHEDSREGCLHQSFRDEIF